MVRFTLTTVGFLALSLVANSAEESQHANTPPLVTTPDKPTKESPRKNEEAESLKKAVRSLSPEQRHRLAENIKAWKQLSLQQQETLRQRDAALKKQATEEVATVVSALPDDQKETFLRRYMEERRKLQANLRLEMEAKRKAGLSELLQRLKQELPASSESPSNLPAGNP